MKYLKFFFVFFIALSTSGCMAFCNVGGRFEDAIPQARAAVIGIFKKEKKAQFIHAEKGWRITKNKINVYIVDKEKLMRATDMPNPVTVNDGDKVLIVTDQDPNREIVLPRCKNYIKNITDISDNEKKQYIKRLDDAFTIKK